MSLRTLARRLPSPIYRTLKRLRDRISPPPRAALPYPNPGPLTTRIAPRLTAIPGWLNLDDLAHFSLVLETQTASGLRGDLLELGCYHGRSAAVLAMHLGPGERLVLADAFDLPVGEPYGDTPTPEGVRRNLQRAVPDLDLERVRILRGDSRALALPADLRLRFAHVDGGHDRETVLSDLTLCAGHLIPGGILAVDDYAHPSYPGVAEGVAAFLSLRGDARPIAELDRLGALGRKLYLRIGVSSPAPEPGPRGST